MRYRRTPPSQVTRDNTSAKAHKESINTEGVIEQDVINVIYDTRDTQQPTTLEKIKPTNTPDKVSLTVFPSTN